MEHSEACQRYIDQQRVARVPSIVEQAKQNAVLMSVLRQVAKDATAPDTPFIVALRAELERVSDGQKKNS